MASPKGFLVYRIWYGNYIAYVGRTKQSLQQRIHGHIHSKRFCKTIDINYVSKIEYCSWDTEADMNLMEIYFIAKYKPALNRDDKPNDSLTIELPEREWKEFVPANWDKWKVEFADQAPTKYTKKARNKRAIKKMKEMESEDIQNEFF